MLPLLPSDDVLYAALISRDPSFEGLAYVGVTTTGIFCRLSCACRKPMRENCLFYASAQECVAAGFRPCRRCRPLEPLGQAHPVVAELMAALEGEPGRRWSEADIAARGLDPSTVRRLFKQHLGVTFLDLARRYRVKTGATAVAMGDRVTDAQMEAGFESASGFRAAFIRALGHAPANLDDDAPLRADWVDSPLGPLLLVADRHALHLLEFFDRKGLPAELRTLERKTRSAVGLGTTAPMEQVREELRAYFAGESSTFQTPLAVAGSPFTRAVWNALQSIPAGETRSYQAVAIAIGKPTAVRAVARANGANSIGILIPCHRVIGMDGDLTGYGGGLWRKRWLLDHERRFAQRQDACSPA